MAQDDRTFSPNQAEANRARQQGLGVGQKEMERQADPAGDHHSTGTEVARPEEGAQGEARSFDTAGGDTVLGEGVPANVDIRDTGQGDIPQEDWGDATDEDAVHGSNHARRGEKTEAGMHQGAKTRKLNKDIVSRRR